MIKTFESDKKLPFDAFLDPFFIFIIIFPKIFSGHILHTLFDQFVHFWDRHFNKASPFFEPSLD